MPFPSEHLQDYCCFSGLKYGQLDYKVWFEWCEHFERVSDPKRREKNKGEKETDSCSLKLLCTHPLSPRYVLLPTVHPCPIGSIVKAFSLVSSSEDPFLRFWMEGRKSSLWLSTHQWLSCQTARLDRFERKEFYLPWTTCISLFGAVSSIPQPLWLSWSRPKRISLKLP